MLDGSHKQQYRLSEAQFGFKSHRSTKIAVVRVQRLCREGHKCVVILDLKVAYESIPRNHILARLKAKVLQWLFAALANMLAPN